MKGGGGPHGFQVFYGRGVMLIKRGGGMLIKGEGKGGAVVPEGIFF